MQKIQNSPLQVEKYYLKELNFQLNQDVSISQQEFEQLEVPQLSITASPEMINDNKRDWKCELIIKTEENSNTPYSFRIVLVGFFSIDNDYPKERTEILAKTNCPSILYSTAREMLTTTIRRSPFPPILLPSVMFLEITEEDNKKAKPTKAKKTTKALKE